MFSLFVTERVDSSRAYGIQNDNNLNKFLGSRISTYQKNNKTIPFHFKVFFFPLRQNVIDQAAFGSTVASQKEGPGFESQPGIF